MFWYMARLMTQQGTPFLVALTDVVDIYRKTSFYHLNDPSKTQQLKPAWQEVVLQLEALFQRHLRDNRPASIVATEATEFLWLHLMQRIDQALPIIEYRADTTFGCFFYNVQGRIIDLHFVNKVMPESPFAKLEDRARELLQLLRYCSEQDKHLSHLKFGSWLNDYPPFRRLFPASWRDSGEKKKYNSLAWWGQFMDHRGGFHAHNANRFRETGDFPYQCTFHQCDIKDLELHLCTLLKGGG